ncbi:hypothetical protein NO1_1824 [Candidatus Termititenax aidoneus]|uniref:DUF6291 domain-containing protein n=1 Tax=Termititenax aidoneus TaxID=2218524 RepID=A0A388TDN9_TERA1|nr:hypothetical protein NO1_1824 [Candidatus Termititenax aidoneus]
MVTTKTKQAFLVYYDYEPIFNELSDEEKASLLMSMFEYERTREIPKRLKGQARIVFIMIRSNLDRDREKWDETKKARSEAGSLGNQLRWGNGNPENKPSQTIANNRIATNPSQDIANIAVNANASATANVIVIDNANANAMHTENPELSTNETADNVDNLPGTSTASALALENLEKNQNTEPQNPTPISTKVLSVPETSVEITENRLVSSTQVKNIRVPAGADYEVFEAAVKKALESFGWELKDFNLSKFTEKYFGQKIKSMEKLVWEWQKQDGLYKQARERREAKKTDWLKRL